VIDKLDVNIYRAFLLSSYRARELYRIEILRSIYLLRIVNLGLNLTHLKFLRYFLEHIPLYAALNTFSGRLFYKLGAPNGSTYLLYADLVAINNTKCAKVFGKYIKSTNLCVATSGGTSTCGVST
jgi:hypothetical protein